MKFFMENLTKTCSSLFSITRISLEIISFLIAIRISLSLECELIKEHRSDLKTLWVSEPNSLIKIFAVGHVLVSTIQI